MKPRTFPDRPMIRRRGRIRTSEGRGKVRLAYKTKLGRFYWGRAEDALMLPELLRLRGRVKLIFTSPPFPLNKKKAYDNLQRRRYLNWLAALAEDFRDLLHPKGSIVVEIGNAWEPGAPVFSTLPVETLLEIKAAGRFVLCQEFVTFNPARLPAPAHWVNVRRIRVKDAFTRIWWMSKTPYPDARNTRVLVEYSDDMKRLLRTRRYNWGTRPSEYRIGRTSFLHRHRGAIPPNVLVVGGTASRDSYIDYSDRQGYTLHPARMPAEVARFFIKFLTRPGEIVLDPFAGSNVTGASAEELGRRWVSIEPEIEYVYGSRGRFGWTESVRPQKRRKKGWAGAKRSATAKRLNRRH